MTNSNGFDADDETRQLLRAADPARSLPPLNTDVLTSLLEDTMNEPAPQSGRTARTGLPRVTLAIGIVAAAALAVITLVNNGDNADNPQATVNGGNPAKLSVTKLSAGPAVEAKCMAPSAEFVSKESLAFEGKVTSVKDGLVTLDPSKFYAGSSTDVVTIAEPDQGMSESVAFQVGEIYLVGAAGGQVSSCLSGPATDELRAVYDEAFAK